MPENRSINTVTPVRELPRPKLSVCVPFYNEEESIAPMHRALVETLEPTGVPFEMVFVDDGSRDSTLAIAVGLTKQDPRVRVVKFRRNYGQTAAMAAGIEAARGDVIVTMDGDLQNDPRDIPRFLELIERGYDIVVGWRHDRQDKLVSRKIPSRIANRLIARVTGVPIRDNGCSLKAYRASLIKRIPCTPKCTASFRPWRTSQDHASPRSRCVTTRASSVNRSTACPAFTKCCWTCWSSRQWRRSLRARCCGSECFRCRSPPSRRWPSRGKRST